MAKVKKQKLVRDKSDTTNSVIRVKKTAKDNLSGAGKDDVGKKTKLAVKMKKKDKIKQGGKMKGLKKDKNDQSKKQKKQALVDPMELINELLKEDDTKSSSQSSPLQGFKVLKWKLNEGSSIVHHLFFKKHEVTLTELVSKEKPVGRTILCHNVPPYFSERHLRDIFKNFGSIQKIYIQQKPSVSVPEKRDNLFPSEKDIVRGYKVAYVVYTDSNAVKEMLKIDQEDVQPIALKKPPKSGLNRWINMYNSRIASKEELEKSVSKFMDNFDKEEVKRKEMEKIANEPDDDGWVTVTRTGKRSSGGLIRSEAMEERLKEKKRRQDKQLLNFTPAQIKETKMKHLLELKKKFEEDKQRVALLKQQRKFKPF